ncbi:methionine adenosyltransferase [Kitasatospora sp. NPDC059648]|uniref:methionine adenosyltransferase n=1 Tax=Kitasatospora sp. NPDC059648 TaxID=3346894 RepID=UPI0036CE86D8
MQRVSTTVQNSSITIETGRPLPTDLVLLERKGLGHPDTLADHLAEELSRAYSRYTLDRFGAVLHHNFDKLALLGGSCEVRYGAGRMTAPVRVLVNGRAAYACGGEDIPVRELVEQAVMAFFHDRLPELAGHLDLVFNITSNPSPGAVVTDESGTDRSRWFAPRSVDDLRERHTLLANDTSLGTGWAPMAPFEQFAHALVNHLSGVSEFTLANPWCGSDVKLMGHFDGAKAEAILCVPQKSEHVPDRAAYLANKEEVLAECARFAEQHLPGVEITFLLNARDVPEKDELYLTYTGSSIESGDEGVVGRGNRVNGLITPLRPMNLEGASGKNPVYHVGKLYNLAATRLAQRLYDETGSYAEVHLVSATGQRLDQPWKVLVRLAAEDPEIEKVQAQVALALGGFPELTAELVHHGVRLS